MSNNFQDRNADVRTAIEQSGLLYWQIAEYMNIRADKLSVMMRYPLSDENRAAIYAAIEAVKEGNH